MLRYNASYTVVDFETVEDAAAASKMFHGRKLYPDSCHLHLKSIDVNDRTSGRRMVASLFPWRGVRKRGRSPSSLKIWIEWMSIWLESLCLVALDSLILFALLSLLSRSFLSLACFIPIFGLDTTPLYTPLIPHPIFLSTTSRIPLYLHQ